MIKIPNVRCMLVHDGSTKAKTRKADNPTDASAIARAHIGNVDREYFICILVDARQEVVGINTVSIGTLTASLVHPREVFKPAILAGAAGVIVAHNHPSGDEKPSPEDRTTTRRMVDAGKLLGIPVLDHIVLGGDGRSFSFRENGLL